MGYIEKEIDISEIKDLLLSGKRIEVDSPDGFVPVTDYVEKGVQLIYNVKVLDTVTRAAPKHLFETDEGWVFAEDLTLDHKMLTREGFKRIQSITCLGEKEEVVDITVDHPNHRYYGDVSSCHNTGVGKTAFLADYAASQLWEGKNVLYVTMEMAEEKVANRIDANMMDISFKELRKVGKEEFFLRCKKIKKANIGKLFVKEFPTSTAGAVEVDHLIKELYQKKGFVPDILCVDYISICKSSRVKLSQGSYLYVKSIAEEFRALAMKHDLVCLSATQTNRDGIDASDFSLKSISESAGLAHTVDWALALMSPEDIAEQGLALAKQLKSRYGDINYMRKFVLGYARDKSYFYDTDLDYNVITGGATVEDEDIPAFDQATNGAFGAELPDPTVSVMNPTDRPTKNDKSGISW